MIGIMSESDLNQVIEIEENSNSTPWSREFFEMEIQSSFSYSFVSREEDLILGFIVVWLIGTEGHIGDFAVRVEHRGQGIGSRLLRHVLDFSIKKGIEEITVTVRVDNLGGIRVYEKAGFVRETTFSDFGNSLLLFLTCDGLSVKEPNFKMPLDKGTTHYMTEVLTPVFASKIYREQRKAALAVEMSDSSLYEHHVQRLDQIRRSLRILQQRR